MAEVNDSIHITIPSRAIKGAFATFMASGILVAMNVPLQPAVIMAGGLPALTEILGLFKAESKTHRALCIAGYAVGVIAFCVGYSALKPYG